MNFGHTEFEVLMGPQYKMSVKHLEVQTRIQRRVKTRCVYIESFSYEMNSILQYRKMM